MRQLLILASLFLTTGCFATPYEQELLRQLDNALGTVPSHRYEGAGPRDQDYSACLAQHSSWEAIDGCMVGRGYTIPAEETQ